MANNPDPTNPSSNASAPSQAIVDTYINSIFGPARTFTATGTIRGIEIPDTRTLQEFGRNLGTPVIGAFTATIPPNWNCSSYFHHPDEPAVDSMAIWLIEGPIASGGVTYASAYAVAGDVLAISCVTQVTDMLDPSAIVTPSATWINNSFTPDVDPALSGFNLKNFECYLINSDNIYEFISEGNLDAAVKILSAYYLVFPSCRRFLRDSCTMRKFTPRSRLLSARAAASEALRMAATVFLVWVPAFSQITKFPGQMFRRYTAMNADGRLVNVTEQDFTTLLTDSGWALTNIPSIVNATIGRAVALTKQGLYDPTVALAELMTLDEYMAMFDPADITKGILEQCRLIFENYQSTSIGFGASVVQLVDKYCASLGVPWTTELENMIKVSHDIANCKYTGCIDTIPEYRQVKSSPRIIYIGVLYYAKCLTDKEEIENFKQYNVDGVRHHIGRQEDKTTCESIVNVLPPPDVVSIASLAEGLSAMDIEKICQSRGDQFRNSLFHQLYAASSKSAWFKQEWDSKEQNAKSVSLKSILKVIEDQYQVSIGNLTSKIARSTDLDERAFYRQRLAGLEDKYLSAKMSLVNLGDLIAASSDMMFDHVRSGLISQYKHLWKVACGTEDDQDGDDQDYDPGQPDDGDAAPTDGQQ